MSFGHKLKSRFFSLQEDFTSSVRNLSGQSSSSVTSGLAGLSTTTSFRTLNPSSPQYKRNPVNPEAGSEILEHYQNQWELIHVANEKNAKSANSVDRKILNLHEQVEKKWNEVFTLQMLVSQIPKINEQIEQIMDTLGNLESIFSDVEVSLLALEDTIDARELQERQLDQRFQVALYQEKRRSEFEELSNRLHSDYTKKKQESQKLSLMLQKQRNRTAGDKFAKDMNAYSKNGHLAVPSRTDPDASLETVDLDEEEEDANTLEAFLDNPSPLPVDEISINKAAENEDDDEEDGNEGIISNLEIPGVSREDSIYFTPASTIPEKMNEI